MARCKKDRQEEWDQKGEALRDESVEKERTRKREERLVSSSRETS